MGKQRDKKKLIKLYKDLKALRDRQIALYTTFGNLGSSLGVMVTHTQNALNRAALLAGMQTKPKRLPLKRKKH